MRYEPIDPALFVDNRRRLTELLPPRAVAIVNANDILPTNADGVLRLKQNSDLFYLTGVDQEESVLVLYPDAPDPKHREILFLRETNETIAIWEGHKLPKEQATEISGIGEIRWLDNLDQSLRSIILDSETVYLNSNEHPRASDAVESRDRRFIRHLRDLYPLHRFERLAPLLHSLRIIKQPAEIDLIRRACSITESGFRRILSFVKPDVAEYEVEAEYIHEFLRLRSDGFAYTPIIASGANNCVLHYLENDGVCRDGELLLLDVGASYANYNSDLTRTIPVNGRFTDRQRAVYEAVLRVLRCAMQSLRPGVILRDYQKQVEAVMTEELMGLGLLQADDVAKQDPDQPLFKEYFMHGTSHHLGLDVHDVGSARQPLAPGMVLTVEPGIYIRDENLGVRLENDVLITEDGHLDLMTDIPIEPDDIEALMRP